MRTHSLAIVLAALTLMACGDDSYTDPTGGVCGDGEQIEVMGVTSCIYGETLIIEGFLCPEEAPERHDLEDAVVCSEEDELSEETLAAVEAKGYNPEPIDAEAGAPCDREGAQGRDDCNDCVCDGGFWSCTEIACQQPEGCNAATTEDACGQVDGECEWAICAQDASCPNISGGACVDTPVNGEACGDDPIRWGGPCVVCHCTDGAWECEGTPCQQCEAFNNAGDCAQAGNCSWAECPQDDFDCPNPEGGICVEPPSSGDSCEVPGVGGADAADGCNSCFCDEGGFWSCTEIACE